jgi:hypothetical protein
MRDYDSWIFTNPQSDDGVGVDEGDTCGRVSIPDDEDAPRNWRPRPCGGLMMVTREGDIVCESCGCHA